MSPPHARAGAADRATLRRAAPRRAPIRLIERSIVDLPWIRRPDWTGPVGAKDSGNRARVPCCRTVPVATGPIAGERVACAGRGDAPMHPLLRRPLFAAAVALLALTMAVPVVVAADFPPSDAHSQ